MGFASVRRRNASRSSSDLMCEVSVGGLLSSVAGEFSNAPINSLTFLPSGICAEILMCKSFKEGSKITTISLPPGDSTPKLRITGGIHHAVGWIGWIHYVYEHRPSILEPRPLDPHQTCYVGLPHPPQPLRQFPPQYCEDLNWPRFCEVEECIQVFIGPECEVSVSYRGRHGDWQGMS